MCRMRDESETVRQILCTDYGGITDTPIAATSNHEYYSSTDCYDMIDIIYIIYMILALGNLTNLLIQVCVQEESGIYLKIIFEPLAVQGKDIQVIGNLI